MQEVRGIGGSHAMATDLTKEGVKRMSAPVGLVARPTPHPARAPGLLDALAPTIGLRPGQDAGLRLDGEEVVLIVRSGVLVMRAALCGGPRRPIALYFPGDAVCLHFAPLRTEPALSAATSAELWRLRWKQFEDLAARDTTMAQYMNNALTRQVARQALHALTLSQLSGDERVATFLLELALRAGVKPSGGASFEVPLSRKELALYLGLNADTLSRIMSRFRTAGVLSRTERHRLVVRDVRELMRLTPAAESLGATTAAQP
jgi:CRP/FNR family transcriptional regulator, anaerobic regulatory protein